MLNLFKIQLLIFVFILLGQRVVDAQSSLSGEIKIFMNEGRIKSNFYLSNLSRAEGQISFMIHEDIKIEEVYINDKPVKAKKVKNKCFDCTIYRLTWNTELLADDTIHLKTSGSFKNYSSGQHNNDYKGKIVNNYGILRASEQSKWYPVMVDNKSKKAAVLQKHAYQYQIKATCDNCKNIYIGQGIPKKSGQTFISKTATEDIMLIAGDFEWVEAPNAIFINVENEQTISHINALFADINDYFQSIFKISMPSKFVFAHLPSDNERWGGFMTYPTIVNVNQNLSVKNLEPYLSHEVAHYLFGDVYKPGTQLFWFYLESFAQYLSYKYLLHINPQLMEKSYGRLTESTAFIRLDQVKEFEEVTNQYRYLIGPFQLLAIENKIGEEKMVKVVKEIFKELENNDNGYQVLINSLSKIEADQKIIRDIENNIIKNFDLKQYDFLKEKISN